MPPPPTSRGWLRALPLALLLLAPPSLLAGGGPFNTLVLVNTNSAASVELGAHYAAVHGIPAHHICPLGFPTNLVSLSSNEFDSLLLAPITNHIAAQKLDGQIDFLVLCQDFPTRVNHLQGLSASLFYGPRYSGSSGCAPPIPFTHNEYHRAERAYRSADSWSSTNGFIAFHLVASNLATAKLVADRGAAALSSFPSSSFYLCMLGGAGRSGRERRFDHTQFSFRSLPGLTPSCVLAPHYAHLSGQTNIIGFHDGFSYIEPTERTNNVWLPGAYADHLTSFGGAISNCANATGQSTVLDWMGIGATASFGTVAEPCAYSEKFPDPFMAFYYARGFSIGEAYAMSVESPYQGLFAGDPLAAPFAAAPLLDSPSHAPGQIVTGSVPVQVVASPRPNGPPPAALDAYLDGRFLAPLASVAPTHGNVLSIAVDGLTNSASVAPHHSLFDAVQALADAINADPSQIVSASAFADRLELIGKAFDHSADDIPAAASVSAGSASALTFGVGLAATNLVPSLYPARKRLYLYAWSANAANEGDTLSCVVTLTNGVAVTNLLVASQGEKITNLLERLRLAINTNSTLMATNGVRYDRLAIDVNNVLNDFTLFARAPGPEGSFIQVDYAVSPVSNSSGLVTNYNSSSFLDDNPDDLRPHASFLFHLRPTNDLLSASASFVTTNLPDGLHTLDFIARDGSAVAAQSRLSLPLVVCNSSPQLALLGTNGLAVTNDQPASLPHGTDFGPIEWGQALTNTFSLTNNGSASLSILGWSTNGPGAAAFHFSGIPSSIEPGAAASFTAVFAPTGGGPHSASLAFDCDAIVPQTNLLFAGSGSPHDQSLSFPPIPTQLVTNVVGLSASASSGLPVSFSIDSGPGALADATNLSFSSHGTVVVVATQSGDIDWNPAPPATNSVVVHDIPTVGPVTAYRDTNSPSPLHLPDLLLLTNSVDPEGSDLSVAWVSPSSTNGGTVSLSNHWVTYSPPAEDDSTDHFAFRVDNAFGGSAANVVEVVPLTPENEASAMNIVSVDPSDSNTLVRFVGIPLRSYDVQFATNLLGDFLTVGNTNIGLLGYAIFTDTNLPPPSQYYRTRRPD